MGHKCLPICTCNLKISIFTSTSIDAFWLILSKTTSLVSFTTFKIAKINFIDCKMLQTKCRCHINLASTRIFSLHAQEINLFLCGIRNNLQQNLNNNIHKYVYIYYIQSNEQICAYCRHLWLFWCGGVIQLRFKVFITAATEDELIQVAYAKLYVYVNGRKNKWLG